MLNLTKLINKIRMKRWLSDGLTVGSNFQLCRGASLDSSFPWLITIGDNVTMAADSYILAHDGSTKKIVGYSKLGKVKIGNNVFIGAKAIVLPGCSVGNDVVIAAGCIVNHDLPSNVVVAGTPAKVIQDIATFYEKHHNLINELPIFEKEYTNGGGISKDRKREMIEKLEHCNGYVV
ncbi:MAG: acyltransferase [Herbinix sp.]|jgi:maltose O-acetyltransferase|nr:acyltransferase [Herbinix sp.]